MKRLIQAFIWAFLLMVVLAAGISASAATSSLLGDVNGDGGVNVLDYALLKRYVMGIGSLSKNGETMADVNKDGKINAIDCARIKGHVLGIYDIHLDKHLFLQSKGKGNCETLDGEISILLVFVSDIESSWDYSTRETAESELCGEMIRMMEYAKGYGVSLSVMYGELDVSVAVDVESYNSHVWEESLCAALGYSSIYDLQMLLERDWEVASAPVVFV
ncbi:MAG: dockerin type I repeat-containing protein, partial [Clostridia bacterium]|nr:dockerin type I repeat-containing protein [Clostridia bacterium]